ncbi:hypothetical protein ACEPAG_8118 [Sanghuangporus baumii]
MLHRLNTSLVTEHPKSEDRRPRNPSSGSSSSTIIPENQQLPIDAVHETVKSDSIGEDFTIIKSARSPDSNHRSLETNNHLHSWRDANRRSKTDRSQGKELPDWLSHTFASLEPDNPLRGLAFSENTSSTCCGSILPNTETTAVPCLNETYSDSVFTFTPPSQVALTADAVTISPLHTELVACEIEREGTMSNLRIDDLEDDYHLTIDDFTRRDAQSKLREFAPFAEPGPFAQKSVHFLTPVRSSPLAIAAQRSQIASDLCSTSQPERDSSVYNPFSTPGPASSFSLPFLEHEAVGVEFAQDDFSDSLTLADQSIDEDADLGFTPVDENIATSTQPFVSNSETLQELLSNPGPSILDASVQNMDSLPKYSLTSDFSVVNPNDRQILPDEQQEESEKMMRFISGEHDRMAKSVHALVVTPGPSSVKRKITFRQSTQKPAFGLDVEQSTNTDDVDDIFIPSEFPYISPCTIDGGADLLDITELSSSSSMCYNRMRNPKNESSLFSSSVARATQDVPQEEFGPHCMHFNDALQRIPSTYHDTGGSTLTTPPNDLSLQAEHPRQSTRNQDSVLYSSTAGLRILTSKPLESHRAFSRCSDIYLSPISKSEDTKYRSTKTGVLEKAKDDGEAMEEGIWNISPFQLSDDSIEEWEA